MFLTLTQTTIRLLCLLLLSFGYLFTKAQISNKPKVALPPSLYSQPHQSIALYAYSPTVNVNYVRTKEAIAPINDEAIFNAAGYQEVKQSTQYLDGLGRPLQTVIRQATPGSSPKDLVSPVIYDNFGREVYKYLPYAQTNGNSDGSFKLNPFGDQESFYKNAYKDANNNVMYNGEQFLFSKTDYESSPLNRINKMMAPGNSWVGSGRGTEQHYLINSIADAVRIWNITYDLLTYQNNDITTNIPVSSSAYNAGELYKNVSKDEHGNAVVEYKDKEGQVVLKKVQIGVVPTDFSGYTNWLCTYYVYDDLNRLRFVIPPKAVEAVKTNWSLSTPSGDIVNELCFRYEYDARNRMIAKKVPGAGWVYMVYDKRDRLVFTQDANMRLKQQWMATIYDALNRPVTTGMLLYNAGWQTLQNYVDGPCTSCESIDVTGQSPGGSGGRVSNMIVSQRISNNEHYQATQSITFEVGFESQNGDELIAEIVTGGSGSGTGFNDNLKIVLNPLPPGSPYIPLTVTFYDDYAQVTNTYSDSYNSTLDQLVPGWTAFPENLPSTGAQVQITTKGMVTASRVRVLEDPDNLGSGKWLTTKIFYDNKGRIIQAKSGNYKGGTDITINRYDFAGKVINNYMVQNNPQATPQTLKVKTGMKYDHAGRLLEVWKTINDEDTKKTLIAKNEYDELGNLKTKQLGQKRVNGAYTSAPIETLDYNYNIRGWLKGINTAYSHPEVNAGVSPERWFGMELNYDWGSTDVSKDQYNGNISSTTWKSKGDGVRRAYGYSYDMANRILSGDFSEYNGTAYADNGIINFDMMMGDGTGENAYDENGNIKKMMQWGFKLTGSTPIDQLDYSYHSNSNKLKAVGESIATATDNKLGDFTDKSSGTDDYGYDRNGNMITDLNKRINGSTGIDQVSGGAIEYNHLNLPWKITVKDDNNNVKGTITYIYDAAGNKLEKRVHDNTNTAAPDKATTYIGGMVYEQNLLQFIGHEEGRTRIKTEGSTNTYINDYFIKDHLGNVRMVLTDELQTDIYPAATLEGSVNNSSDAAFVEKKYYSIEPAYVVNRQDATGISDYPNNNVVPNNNANSNTTALSEKLYKLNSNNKKIGLGISLKVMAGDEINIYGKSYYFNSSSNIPPPGQLPVSAVLDMFLGGSSLAGKGLTSSQLTTEVPGLLSAMGAYTSQGRDPASKPKAFINWIFFDEQFKYAGGSFDEVGVSGQVKDHNKPNITAPKNGYVFVYCSNETPVDVFFDNLQVIHTKGPLLEETHYYPFGLTMSGISSKAAGGIENKRKFNMGSELQNKEFSDDSGLELYATQFRSLDPQLGRWWQIDPKASENESPYASMSNNPIRFNDPLGDTIVDAQIRSDKNWSKAYNTFLNSKAGKSFVKLYSPGGKYGKTTVEFKVGNQNKPNNTKVFSINRKDGSSTILKTDKMYDGIDKVAKGESKDSYLKFEISLRSGNDINTSDQQVDDGESILHETQHVRIGQQTLITDKGINHPFYQHRDWMKPTSSDWYKQRAGFYQENKQMWQADYERQKAQGKVRNESEYIQNKVNDFFN